jgi:hypothetical protein
LASLADRGISIANRLGSPRDATEESCRAEQHGTNRVGLATAKSSISTKLDTEAQTVRCTPHGNIELVPQKQVFDFKPAPRPKQVGDKRHKQMKERKHHVE